MTKKLIVDPGKVRKSGTITPKKIPVNTYTRTLEDEIAAKDGISLAPAFMLQGHGDYP